MSLSSEDDEIAAPHSNSGRSGAPHIQGTFAVGSIDARLTC